jgi:tetratricopeptide (TPR) repeat protein
MTSGRDLVQRLQDHREKALAVGGAVGVIASAARALFSKAAPPILWLAIFSLLLLAAGVWMAVQSRKAPRSPAGTRTYTPREVGWAWGLGGLAVVLAWGIVFRERILYSEVFSRTSHRPLALISPSLAWQVLRYQDAAGEDRYNTIAGEAALLLTGTPYQVVVMETRGRQPTERDAFVLQGVLESGYMVLKAQMILTGARTTRMLEQVKAAWKPPDRSNAVVMLTPLKRYLRNPFLFSGFGLEVPVGAQEEDRVKMLLARLVLRYAVAMTLYFDGDSAARRAFGEILSLAPLLPSAPSPPLANIYRSTSYYFANQGRDLDRSVAALDVVHRLAPDDHGIPAAKAFLLLSAGESDEAGAVLAAAEPNPLDPGALPAVKGEYLLRSEQYDSAIAAFREALKVERDEFYRVPLLTNIALTYGMHPRISASVSSSQMIRHLEDAIALEPADPVTHILQGYAWALANNASLSRREFARADSLIPKEDSGKRKLQAYWLGRSLLALKSSPHAIDTLLQMIGPPGLQSDADLALIFARNLMEVTGRSEDAEEYLDRALELAPESGAAHRYKAMALIRRIEKAGTSSGRDSLLGAARDQLRQALRFGEEGADIRLLLAEVYRESGDTINAEGQEARACEIKADEPVCLFREAERLVAQGEFAHAAEVFRSIDLIDSTESTTPLQEAIIWYKAGRLAEAERANRRALQLDPNSYTAHDNLGFILFDLQRVQAALSQWEQALRIESKAADALAGKAIALAALGNRSARETYARAVQLDERYRDCEVMRREFLWSLRACASAADLIAALPPRRDTVSRTPE